MTSSDPTKRAGFGHLVGARRRTARPGCCRVTISVVGAGPNGLAAAIELAQAGHRVRVYEQADRAGGGTQSAALTLPGFVHDVCSAVHPMGVASPFFRRLALQQHGVEWIHPPLALAHPFDDGTAAVLERSIDGTAATLDAGDRSAYRKLRRAPPPGNAPHPRGHCASKTVRVSLRSGRRWRTAGPTLGRTFSTRSRVRWTHVRVEAA